MDGTVIVPSPLDIGAYSSHQVSLLLVPSAASALLLLTLFPLLRTPVRVWNFHCLPANKLVCYCFINADRRYRIAEPWHNKQHEHHCSLSFPCSQVSWEEHRAVQVNVTHGGGGVCIIAQEYQVWYSHHCPLLPRPLL